MKTTEQMIEVIYEEIANKELSFGCKLKNNRIAYLIWKDYNENWEFNNRYRMIDDWENIFTGVVWNVIWHPVMIWDVLDWMEQRVTDVEWMPLFMWIMQSTWKHKRKPIEEQSEECIIYIYNLIKW